MTPAEAWKKIINKLYGKQVEFPTTPKNKRTPVWFSATSNGEIVLIDKAKDHQPSCNISMPRTLNYEKFEKMYSLYFRRKNGEQVSAEAISTTVNQVYYYSLIKHICQEE